MATPFLQAAASACPRKRRYNEEFCAARVTVENSIGILKERWRVLSIGMGYHDMKKASNCILGLASLHNFILKNENEKFTAEELAEWRERLYEEDPAWRQRREQQQNPDPEPLFNHDQHVLGIQTRDKILRTFYHHIPLDQEELPAQESEDDGEYA